MTISQSVHMLAQVSADQIVNCLLQGAAIAFLAWAVLRLNGRTGAVTRFAVWFSALLAIAALPFASLLGWTGVTGGTSSPRTPLTLPNSWAAYLFTAWVVIAALSLLKVATGLYRIWQLRRGCAVIDPASLDPLLQQTLGGFSSRRPVTLCTSETLNVPAAIGFFKPAVVFPTWTIEELSATELNSILLHELAHLGRWDDWTNLAQKLARAILFFHPAIWWIDSKLSLEREIACDDVVLAHTANPRAYAECLVSLTEKGLLHRGFSLVQAAISRVRQTSLRVTQILDRDHLVSTRIAKPAFGMLAVALFSVTALSPMAPRLVSFDAASGDTSRTTVRAHRQSSAKLETAAFHPVSNASDGSEKVRLVNASFHPDALSTRAPAVKTVRDQPKRNKFVPARRRMTKVMSPSRQMAEAEMIATTFDSPTALSFTEPAQVFLVVQERVYNMHGQSLMTLSVYRFTTVHPDTSHSLGPKKI